MAAAEHPWRLDLSSLAAILAAAGTGALAIFTAWLAFETRDLARETEEDVRSEWRPVVMETSSFSVQVTGGDGHARATFGITNVGRGPALNGSVTIRSESSTETKTSECKRLETLPLDQRPNVPVGGVLYRDDGPHPWLRYTITIVYEDLARRSYTTELIYEDPESGNRTVPIHNEVNFNPTLTSSNYKVGRVRRDGDAPS